MSVATAAARGASSSTRRRAPAPALIASALASSFGMTLNYVPTLALAAAAAPRGLEAVGYSSLVCVADAATAIGSVVAARARRRRFDWGDPGASPGSSGGRSWKDLDVFVWTCAGCKLLPLLALPLVARVVGDAKRARGGRAATKTTTKTKTTARRRRERGRRRRRRLRRGRRRFRRAFVNATW